MILRAGGFLRKSGFPSIFIESFVVFTLILSLVSSFLRAFILSVSLILKFSIFVMWVFPFAKAARIANVMTRSGVSFMSTFPRAFN